MGACAGGEGGEGGTEGLWVVSAGLEMEGGQLVTDGCSYCSCQHDGRLVKCVMGWAYLGSDARKCSLAMFDFGAAISNSKEPHDATC